MTSEKHMGQEETKHTNMELFLLSKTISTFLKGVSSNRSLRGSCDPREVVAQETDMRPLGHVWSAAT